MLTFEGCKLIEIKQAAEEERDAGFSFVWSDAPLVSILFHKLNLAFKHFFVHLEGELMDDIDFRIQALGY